MSFSIRRTFMDALIEVFEGSGGASVAGLLRLILKKQEIRFTDGEEASMRYLAQLCWTRNSLFELSDADAITLVELVSNHMPEVLEAGRLVAVDPIFNKRYSIHTVEFARAHHVQAYESYLVNAVACWSEFRKQRYFFWKRIERNNIQKPSDKLLSMVFYHSDFILDAHSMAHELAYAHHERQEDRELFESRLAVGNDNNPFVIRYVERYAD